jgi:Helix-turn-helix
MAVSIETRCCNCRAIAARLDERGWCEQCVLDLDYEACLLVSVEELIAEWLCRGYPREHLLAAVEMSLADADGPIADGLLVRNPGGGWHPAPSALAFDERRPCVANRIGELRYAGAGMSLEALARRVEVDATELALWEAGALPPRDRAEAIADVFGVSPSWLLKSDKEVS